MSDYRWTQPCCQHCWETWHPHEPIHVQPPESETCVYCGQHTQDGIYIRVDPNTAPHPTLKR